MKVGFKSLMIAMVLLLVAAPAMNDLYAQTRRGEQKVEKQSDNVAADAEDEGFADFDEEADFEEIEFEEAETPSKSVKAKNVPEKEYFIERELKRHQNEMKKIKLTKKRANQMFKKSVEDEAKELKRHSEAVEEIKNK